MWGLWSWFLSGPRDHHLRNDPPQRAAGATDVGRVCITETSNVPFHLTPDLLMIRLRVECDRWLTEGFLFCCSPQCAGFIESVRSVQQLLRPRVLLGHKSACASSGRGVCSQCKCHASSPSSPLFLELLQGACGVSGGSGRHLLPVLSLAGAKRTGPTVCDVLRAELRAVRKERRPWKVRAERAGWWGGASGGRAGIQGFTGGLGQP